LVDRPLGVGLTRWRLVSGTVDPNAGHCTAIDHIWIGSACFCSETYTSFCPLIHTLMVGLTLHRPPHAQGGADMNGPQTEHLIENDFAARFGDATRSHNPIQFRRCLLRR
jgi:hypothetical protein